MARILPLVLAAALPALALAQPAPPMTLAGSLANADGAPLTGNYTLVLRLYDVAEGGTALVTETVDVQVRGGRFVAPFGRDPGLRANHFREEDGSPAVRWLGVTVNRGEELAPRARFGLGVSAYEATQAGETASLAGTDALDYASREHSHPAYLDRTSAAARYAGAEHAHTEYSPVTHDHAALYAAASHSHGTLYAALTHNHAGRYAALLHGHSELAPLSHAHDALYPRRSEAQSLFAPVGHAHDARYATKDESDLRYLVPASADERYLTLAEAAAELAKKSAYDTRAQADQRYAAAGASTAQFLTASQADGLYARLESAPGDFSVSETLTVSGENGITFSDGSTLKASQVTPLLAGGVTSAHTHNTLPDRWCPGTMVHGICLAHYRQNGDATFLGAAAECARRGADIASDSQMWVLRYMGHLLSTSFWTSSFADNDVNAFNEANGGMPDDPHMTSAYSYACVHNMTPPAVSPSEQMVDGVRVTYVHDVNDSSFRLASRVCASLRSDICSDGEIAVLRSAGNVVAGATRLWSSSHSDNDSNYFAAITGASDNTQLNHSMGFVCCAGQRPADLSCPGELIDGVCTTKIENVAGRSFMVAAKDCSSIHNSRLCSIAESAVLRQAGRLTTTANWTESHSDNDGGPCTYGCYGPYAGVGSTMPNDPHPDGVYGYACCL